MRLNDLGLKYRTDKASNHHNYLDIYQTYIEQYRNKNIVLVDAVGGYQYPDRGGESLRMWADFLPMAKIVGIDLYPKQIAVPKNVKIYQCDQNNENGLLQVFYAEGWPDVFIDDFSHINPLTIRTFEICFPLLKAGGVYIVEDTETSYWIAVATDGTDFKGGDHEGTVMNYFKKLSDSLNFGNELGILGIHFYKGCIIILKL